MATELIRKDVDGHVYEFEQFGAKLALKVLVRLSKLIGKPMALAAGVLKKGEDKLDSNMLAQAVEALTSAASEDDVLALIELLCSEKVLCDGKKIDFNSHYEGKMDHLFRVLQAALEVQYGNFFAAIQGNLS